MTDFGLHDNFWPFYELTLNPGAPRKYTTTILPSLLTGLINKARKCPLHDCEQD